MVRYIARSDLQVGVGAATFSFGADVNVSE